MPVRQQKLYEQVEEQIRESIRNNEFVLGDRLPSDRELADLFQTSRPVVREAIRSLEAKGIISVRPGVKGGAFIVPMTVEPMVETISHMLFLGQITNEDILNTWLLLEPPLAAQAADRCSEEDALKLKDDLEAVRQGFAAMDRGEVQAVKPVPPGADNLHRFIAELSGNHMALLLMDTLMRVVGEKTCLVDFTAEEKKAFMKQHEDIVNAIISGSAEEARRASEAHIRAVYAIHHRQAGREKGAF